MLWSNEAEVCHEDIQKYIELFTGDKKEKASLLKDILKHKKYQGPKNERSNTGGGDINWFELYLKRDKKGLTIQDIANITGYSYKHTQIQLKKIEYKIDTFCI